LRITLLTNRDLASNYALNLLLPKLSADHQLRLFCSDRVGSQPEAPALATLSFYEQTLPMTLLFPLIDAQSKQGELLTFQGLNRYLTAPMGSLNQPNTQQGLDELATTEPDLVISIRYGRILEADALSIPRHGALNLHSGRLPQYRGVMATFRAMLAGDELLGSTLHWIDDATIDTGRIISIQSQQTDPEACYLANTIGLYPAGCAALADVVDMLETGKNVLAQTPKEAGRYYSFPSQSDLEAFAAAGHEWTKPDFVAELLSRYLAPDLSN
jgi:methionyl-tRNA formyltransferase